MLLARPALTCYVRVHAGDPFVTGERAKEKERDTRSVARARVRTCVCATSAAASDSRPVAASELNRGPSSAKARR